MTEILALSASFFAVAYAAFLAWWILKQPSGDDKMREIARAIQEGAEAFLTKQYRAVALVGAVIAVAIAFSPLGWQAATGFVVGAIASALAGIVGMLVSVRANVRVAEAAKKGLGPAFSLSFKGGAVWFCSRGIGVGFRDCYLDAVS